MKKDFVGAAMATTVALIVGLALASVAEAQTCDLINVNLGGSTGDTTLTISCLEPAGCSTVTLSAPGCGCDSACASALASGMSQGDVETVDLAAALVDGDTVCSSAQVSVMGAQNNFVRGTFFGRQFSFGSGTTRRLAPQCVVYAFRSGTNVDLHTHSTVDGTRDASPAQQLNGLAAHTTSRFTALDPVNRVITINATDDVLVACHQPSAVQGQIAVDYRALVPLSADAKLYGWSSTTHSLQQVDCETLDAVTTGVTCTMSDSSSCLGSVVNSQAFSGSGGALAYSGASLVATPSLGLCLSGGTMADGDGDEATSFLPADYATTFAVFGKTAEHVAVLSIGSVPVVCAIETSDGDLVDTITTSGTSTEVLQGYRGPAAGASAGDRISCDGNVVIVVDYSSFEAPLAGLQPTAQTTAFRAAQCTGATSSPTPSPTAGPSASPTADPTTSPSLTPTASPSASPTAAPSSSPTASPSANPTADPTVSPSSTPSASPTVAPSTSANPTASPSSTPTANPSATPTTSPSKGVAVTAGPSVDVGKLQLEADGLDGISIVVLGGIGSSLLFGVAATLFIVVRRKGRRQPQSHPQSQLWQKDIENRQAIANPHPEFI